MPVAQLVIQGPTLYSPAMGRIRNGAVAVAGERIVDVGPATEVLERAPAGVRRIDVDGGTILPGFIDAHVHPDHGGLEMARCQLADVHGRDAYLERIDAYARAHPEAPWILGGGWSLPDFPGGTPHRSVLDAVVADRPVLLSNRDHHGVWVNSRALQLAGITASTPDPLDGRIERDEDGSPSGTLHEGAMELMSAILPPTTAEEIERALLDAQAYLHSLGITGWQDAIGTAQTIRAYQRLRERGDLTARVVIAQWWDREQGLEQIDEMVERRDGARAVRADAVKIMQDGIVENFTAGMLEPYLDVGGRPTANRGKSFVEPALLNAAVARLDALGFQVHVHAIGDRAVREALDAFEHARAVNGSRDARHHIAHVQVVHPDDVPRFGALGVVANCQPYWACLEDQMRHLCLPFLGEERSRTQYPFRGFVRTGARLAFGSDWPVTTPDPLKIMQVAVTRVPEDGRGDEPFLPEERLTLEECLHAHTMGSAFVNRVEDVAGSLEPGKLADLCVVDRDVFEVEPLTLGDSKVTLTMVGGETVYAS
jgi:predicted amidohydrolase YtcJ